MNKIVMCALAVAAMFSLNSCFKDEPLNAECDIDKMTLHVASPENVFFQLSDTVKDVAYSDTVMSITVRAGADELKVERELVDSACAEFFNGFFY